MFLTPSARRRARFLAVSFLLVLGTGLLLSTAWQVYHRSAFAHTVLSYRFEYGEEPVTLPGSGQYHDGVPLEEMDFQTLGYVPDDNMRRAERYPVESYPLLDDVTYYRRENGRMAVRGALYDGRAGGHLRGGNRYHPVAGGIPLLLCPAGRHRTGLPPAG